MGLNSIQQPVLRTRIEQWSLPAPQRKRTSAEGVSFTVSDSALLDDSTAIIVYEAAPNPASLVTFSPDTEVRES